MIDCEYPCLWDQYKKKYFAMYMLLVMNYCKFVAKRCGGNLWCVLRKMWEDAFQIRTSAFVLQTVTNLKYTNTNRANAPEVLCSLIFTPVSFNLILRGTIYRIFKKTTYRFKSIKFYFRTVLNSGDVPAFLAKTQSNSLALKYLNC